MTFQTLPLPVAKQKNITLMKIAAYTDDINALKEEAVKWDEKKKKHIIIYFTSVPITGIIFFCYYIFMMIFWLIFYWFMFVPR